MAFRKKYLLTPGPTQIPETVLAASAKQIIHHRTPEFIALLERVQNDLKYLFQTEQDVLMLTCSGTGAMEASITNLFSPGEKVITVNGGKFGDRWTKIAKAYGLQPIEIKLEPGVSVDVSQIEALLNQHNDIKGVLFQASETSTGTLMPTEQIAGLVKKYPDCLCICDAITALGVMPLPMDKWSIDVLITGSQKALMLPPGMACIALSEKAWKKNETAKIPHFYFDLKKEKKGLPKGQTAWTPAINLIIGLEESMRILRDETLEGAFQRQSLLALATRNAMQALGLRIVAEKNPSNAVTAVYVPEVLLKKDPTFGKQIPKLMRDRFGVSIAGGQDELEGKIFRLTHLGYIDRFDILVGIGALELTLHTLGYTEPTLGVGTAAVLKTFHETV